MPYKFYNFVRRVDADTMNMYMPNLTNCLQIDTATANTTKILGQSATTKILQFCANQTDTNPVLKLIGNSTIDITLPSGQAIRIYDAVASEFLRIYYSTPDQIIEGKVTDKNIFLKTTGTGVVKFGTYTAGAATDSTGYISILDAAGNARKLMVQA